MVASRSPISRSELLFNGPPEEGDCRIAPMLLCDYVPGLILTQHPDHVIVCGLTKEHRLIVSLGKQASQAGATYSVPDGPVGADGDPRTTARHLMKKTGFGCAGYETVGTFFVGFGPRIAKAHFMVGRDAAARSSGPATTSNWSIVQLDIAQMANAVKSNEMSNEMHIYAVNLVLAMLDRERLKGP